MPLRGLRALLDEMELRVSELIRLDLAAAVAGCAGGVWIGIGGKHGTPVVDARYAALPAAAGLVGVVIGAVVAGVAVQAAFMDQAFIRKLNAINRRPVRYLTPFIVTAVLGLWAAIAIIVVAALSASAPAALRGMAYGLAGFLSIYTIASLWYGLKMLVDFVALKEEAAGVPDEAVAPVARLPRRDPTEAKP